MLAKPRARAGNAKLWVKVNLCRLSLSEYGPTLPLAAALNKAYSKSNASKSEYLAVMVDDLLLLSHGSLALDPMAVTAAATEFNEDVVLDEAEGCPLWFSDMSSTEVCSGEERGYNRNSLAWSGCNNALLGLRTLGVGDGIGEDEVQAAGDGDT